MMKRVSRSASNEEGYILMMGICIMMVLMLFGVALAVMGLQEFDLSSRTKLMDQAYLIADAGVNSAAVAIENTPASPVPVYPVYHAATASGITIPFGGGNFTYKIYQSEQNTDSTYKVIQSTGTITARGKTVDRTILARIVIGAGGQDYDASFDYLMYNGMSDNHQETWDPSSQLDFNGIEVGLDGANHYLGHYPLGAIYVDGNIKIPTSRKGSMTIQGRIVATGDVDLENSSAANKANDITVTGNVNVPGNIIAGLGGIGDATVTTAAAAGFVLAISVSGDVCASNNVTVTSSASVNKSSPLDIGGIRAGDKAAVTNEKGKDEPLNITPLGVIAGNKVDVRTQEQKSNVVINGSISADNQNNLAIFSGLGGVSLQASGNSSEIKTGNICSNGSVTTGGGDGSVSTGNITTGNPPVVGARGDVDLYAEAGLSATVKLLKPNWAYFELIAGQDDVANGPETKICPNLNCRRTVNSTNPGEYPDHPAVFPNECPTCHADITNVPAGPAHMISQSGPGDTDYSKPGIQFTWNSSIPYSSNEVVYNGDPNVNVYIDVLKWSNQNPNVSFTGTIVSKGSVYITASNTDWDIYGGQTLNIVSGLDIQNYTSGLVSNTDCILHLWAQHDIDFNYIYININNINNLTFYGSFTAGNQIKFNSGSKWENTNFKWSRWALDPVAWAPSFQVLDWREI